ncbi:MAG TPA: GerMN domain-containing protein [Acidobacteriota bacterium]|nr:GerMN domain-containing protein [Acidobacteriota bacterium]
MSTRNMLIIAAAMLVTLAAVVIAVVLTLGDGSSGERAVHVIKPRESEEAEPPSFEVPQQLEMVVFFQSPRRPDLLIPARRAVFNTISLDQQADQLLQKLIQGPSPSEGLLATVPEGTTLQRLYLAEDGTAFVVFNRALVERHQGGVSGELMTVYSIVNTLCVNFPSIRRVQILIEGAEVETLAGHVDISQPLGLNEELFVPTPAAADESEEEESAEQVQ